MAKATVEEAVVEELVPQEEEPTVSPETPDVAEVGHPITRPSSDPGDEQLDEETKEWLDAPLDEEPYPDFTGIRVTEVLGKSSWHGGLLWKRADGSGIFRPTSFDGTNPAFGHNQYGDLEFQSLDDLRNRLQ